MQFRLMYRNARDSDLSVETINAESFEELFSLAVSRARNDVSYLCTIVPLDRMESIGAVVAISGYDRVLST